MGKFLDLCEEFDPRNTEDPKWKLIDFLKSKGVNVSMIRNTDMLYIDTGTDTISISVNDNEEDESINASVGTYEVDREVEKLGDKAMSGPMGLAGKMFGTSAQQAKAAVKRRQNVAKKAIDAYDKGTQRIEKGLQAVKQSAVSRTY